MLNNIRKKIRGLVEDFEQSDIETFEYTISKIFPLAESNINSIISVLKNGTELGTGEYSYDPVTNKIEITLALIQGDIIEVDYTYNKYSDTELNGYIRSALVFISVYSKDSEKDFELETETIEPTPTNIEIDLISLVASILIKPDWTRKSLPNLTVVYPRNLSKEKKIELLIQKFNSGIGIVGLINLPTTLGDLNEDNL